MTPTKKINRNVDPKDGGFLSRKLLLALVLVLVSTSVLLLSSKLGMIVPSMEAYFGLLVAVYAIYCGANVGNKFGVGKIRAAEKTPAQGEEAQQDEQSPT